MLTNIDDLVENISNNYYSKNMQLAIYNNSPDRQKLQGKIQSWYNILTNIPILTVYISDLPIDPVKLREALIELGEQAFNHIK